MPAATERSGPARGNLSRSLIVQEALHLAAEQGLAAMSTRWLAARLGVEAMTLYRYVPSRDARVVLIADRSAATIPRNKAASWSPRTCRSGGGEKRSPTTSSPRP